MDSSFHFLHSTYNTTKMSLATEISVANFTVTLGLCLVFTWLWSLLSWVYLRPKKLERFLVKQGIRGNRYRIFHGDLKEMKALRARASLVAMPAFSHDYMKRARPFNHRAVEIHGKNYLTWEGPTPMMNIGEVELAREIFSRWNEFQKPKFNPIISMLVRGLFSYEGEKWVQRRKLLNPAFHMEKLKLMLPAFYTSCSEMVKDWEEKVLKSEQEIDVSDYLTMMSADSISRAAFGSSYEEGKQIFQLIKEQINVVDQITQSVYFPGLRFLPTRNNKRMRSANKKIKNLLAQVIEKRKEGREQKNDLLGLLMESNLENGTNNNSNKNNVRISTDEMVDECRLFYLAGQETTSSLLTWTLILLSKHDDWQSRAREEVLTTIGNKNPQFDDLNRLKTINMIFQEVMRLYPPVIEAQRRVVKDNTKLRDLTLPRGCMINLPIQYIHQDRDIWGEDAKEFNPERFAQGISKASKGGVAFLAFGWGPRICIGSNFAMVEAKIALSMILQRFEFELSPSYAHAPNSYGLLFPQFGAPLLFRRL